MKEYKIYTKRLAEYLVRRGFKIVTIIPNILQPQFKNWIFEDSPELHAAITEYTKELR